MSDCSGTQNFWASPYRSGSLCIFSGNTGHGKIVSGVCDAGRGACRAQCYNGGYNLIQNSCSDH